MGSRTRPATGTDAAQAVKAVVMYFRTNITQELIAELLFVDQSTISRAISDLEEIIAEALDEFVPELPEEIDGRVAIVDGSLCPCCPGPMHPSCTRASARPQATLTSSSAIFSGT